MRVGIDCGAAHADSSLVYRVRPSRPAAVIAMRAS
jgi:hypothetical protein